MDKPPLEAVTSLRKEGSTAPACLGAMNFGKRTNEAEAKKIIHRAVELGIRHIDTANAYNDGVSEKIVGDAVKGRRDELVIATKCGFGRVEGKFEGLSRARLLGACDESLKRLGTDWIDIYYLHVPDRATPIEETLDAIAELFEKKKIRAWGISNYASWQILEMFPMAEARKIPRPAIAQQLYNVLIRQLDIEYFAFARRYELHTVIYNPLAGGLLSGKHARDGSTQRGSRFDKNRLYQGRYFNDTMFDRVEDLTKLATDHGMSLLELAYAWVATSPGVDSVLVGPASVAQLDEGVRFLGRGLAHEIRAQIDELCRAWSGTDATYVRG